jgi:ATP-dependent Zn protease
VTLLQKHKQDLIKIAEALIEFETLSKEEIQELLSGKKIKKF